MLITGSVVLTPIVGIWGPFANGSGTAPPEHEYFLPAGFVFGTVWTINYLGLAADGIWQALPRLRSLGHQRLRGTDRGADLPPALEGADTDSHTASDSTKDSPSNPVLLCPSCGRVMQRRPILRPQGRCPP